MIDVDAIMPWSSSVDELCRNVRENNEYSILRVQHDDLELEYPLYRNVHIASEGLDTIIKRCVSSSRAFQNSCEATGKSSRFSSLIPLDSDLHATRYPPMMDKTGKPLSVIESVCGFKPQHIGTRTPVSLQSPLRNLDEIQCNDWSVEGSFRRILYVCVSGRTVGGERPDEELEGESEGGAYGNGLMEQSRLRRQGRGLGILRH